MKKHLLLFLMCILLTDLVCQAQTIERSVISAGASSLSGPMSLTIGEVCNQTTLEISTSILTQGFQQPEYEGPIQGISGASENFRFQVFPNPTRNHIVIEWEVGYDPLLIEMYDLSGKTIMNKISLMQRGNHCIMDLTILPQGIYHLRLTQKVTLIQDYTQIVKI